MTNGGDVVTLDVRKLDRCLLKLMAQNCSIVTFVGDNILRTIPEEVGCGGAETWVIVSDEPQHDVIDEVPSKIDSKRKYKVCK